MTVQKKEIRPPKTYRKPQIDIFGMADTDVLTSSSSSLTPGSSELPYRPFGGLLGEEDTDFLSR